MSIERAFEPWEEMQRHGQDLADRFTQGFLNLLRSPIIPSSLTWPSTQPKSANSLDTDAILNIGNRISRAGSEFGACLNGVVQQFVRRLPTPFRQENGRDRSDRLTEDAASVGISGEGFKMKSEEIDDWMLLEKTEASRGNHWVDDDGIDLMGSRHFGRSQGSISITSSYDSRTNDIESSLVARGDLWRIEASHGGSTSGNENLPLFLFQVGPVLFVRDTTLLLPVHLSKQHLLWYGYDRKNGLHSLCPALWSKHRRWLFMSMIYLNPLACSFMDLQFPNGQLTYIPGEGLTLSAFLSAYGGLLQAQGQYPGKTKLSFSCKNKRGTQITPILQLPDKSLSLELAQTLAWKQSGLIVQPSSQLCICPTFGGSNPGLRAELIQSLREKLSLICGYSLDTHSTAFASLAIGRSKWNGYVGSSGMVVRLEAPLSGIGRPSFSIQLNRGADF